MQRHNSRHHHHHTRKLLVCLVVVFQKGKMNRDCVCSCSVPTTITEFRSSSSWFFFGFWNELRKTHPEKYFFSGSCLCVYVWNTLFLASFLFMAMIVVSNNHPYFFSTLSKIPFHFIYHQRRHIHIQSYISLLLVLYGHFGFYTMA